MRIPRPRTLLWQSFLLFVLLMGLSLLAWFNIYQHFARQARAEQTAQMVASVVNLTRSALLASDSARRSALLGELISQEGLRIYPAEPGDRVLEADASAFMLTLGEHLRERLDTNTRLARSVEGVEGFFVSFALDTSVPEDRYWLMIPAERIPRGGLAGWIGWGIVVVALSLLGAWLIVFSLTRPLKSLEEAARTVGRGQLPAPLPTSGPRELHAVAEAFNQMSSDLAQLESDRALILAGVSHDLRTPLARLRLGLEMSGARASDIEAMSCDIEEMDRIIGQFLDFARDTQGAAPEPTLPGHFLDEVLRPYLRRKLPIELHLDSDAPLLIRPDALRRALANLLDNALRYAGSEAPIELRVQHTAAHSILEVADRGPGIPPDEVEYLKRPFTRQEAARSNAGGSGLGLAIVERIVRQHGGELSLLPRPGGGLLARISLPRQQDSTA